MGKYNINKDFKKYEGFIIPFTPKFFEVYNLIMSKIFTLKKNINGIHEVKRKIPGYNNVDINITIFEPVDICENAPCLIYFHGGAFILQPSNFQKKILNQYSVNTRCKVIFVDYRLAIKHPFPNGVEDCYSACKWVYDNAEQIGINKNKIAVGGDSAGGNLAAAVTLMARDRKTIDFCYQMLIYPVIDERQITESMNLYHDTPIWNSKLNNKMWKLYLRNGVTTKREYASPIEATNHENLPNAYIEVTEFDPLRDEGIAYAEALIKSGVNVQLNKTLGTVHGYEIAQKSEIVAQNIQVRIEALKNAFK